MKLSLHNNYLTKWQIFRLDQIQSIHKQNINPLSLYQTTKVYLSKFKSFVDDKINATQ